MSFWTTVLKLYQSHRFCPLRLDFPDQLPFFILRFSPKKATITKLLDNDNGKYFKSVYPFTKIRPTHCQSCMHKSCLMEGTISLSPTACPFINYAQKLLNASPNTPPKSSPSSYSPRLLTRIIFSVSFIILGSLNSLSISFTINIRRILTSLSVGSLHIQEIR